MSKFTHNIMMYGELGMYPLSVMIKKRMVNYWTTILKSPGNKLNRVMYDIVYDLHKRGLYTSMWINTIKEILEQNGKNYIWLNQDCMFNSKLIYISECDSFKQLWHSIIVNDDNYSMYKLYKHVHICEMYTHVSPEYLKIALFQFRIGTYKLPANNKFNNISIDEQICTICDKAVKGDEIHFTFECDRLRDIRQKYILTSFTDSNSNKHAFVKLLQSIDLLIKFSKFVLLGLIVWTCLQIVIVIIITDYAIRPHANIALLCIIIGVCITLHTAKSGLEIIN